MNGAAAAAADDDDDAPEANGAASPGEGECTAGMACLVVVGTRCTSPAPSILLLLLCIRIMTTRLRPAQVCLSFASWFTSPSFIFSPPLLSLPLSPHAGEQVLERALRDLQNAVQQGQQQHGTVRRVACAGSDSSCRNFLRPAH